MKVRTYTLSLILLILGLSTTLLRAQDKGQASSIGYPTLDRAVEITDMRLLGNATKGANVSLQVRFRAHVDGPGTIMLRYPKHVAPPGRRPEETYRTKSLRLKKGKKYVKTYPMRVHDTGGAMVSAIVRAEEVPEGYDASASEHVNVVSGTDTYQVFAPGDTTRRRVTATKGGAGKSNTNAKAEAKSSTYYTVSVSGQIEYLDEDESPNRVEGLYGSEVELWFRDSSNPDALYHPLGEAEHVTYDEVEEDGQYHFNFGFSGDLSGYDELLVLVTSANDAASLSIDQGSWIIDSGDGTETSFGTQQGVVYDISGMGTDISIADADAEVNSRDGAILRNMMLARESVEELYDGSVPFNLPVVPVLKEDLSNLAGRFRCEEDFVSGNERRNIKIDPAWTDISTVTHEYGHFVHYSMWGDCTSDNNFFGGDPAYADATDQVAEGWAISFSFAARNYANDAYGDALRNNDDNTEVAPFRVDPFSGNRFETVRYAETGNPAYAAFASYLWNLYDSYSGGSLEASLYDDGDNDDVSGHEQRVFEVFRNEHTTASDYNNAFKNGLGSDTQTSVQSVFDFMTADYSSVPNTPMRPPQLTGASGQIKSDGDASLQWNQRSYPTGRDYGNYPGGYRVYKDGRLLGTVSSGTTSYTASPSGTNSGRYRLTAYNGDGEAQSSPTLYLGIDASISGPGYLNSGETGTWTASVSGGSGSTSYDWEWRPAGGTTWYDKSCTGSSCSHTFYAGDHGNGGIRVTATRGAKRDDATKYVFVQPNCDDRICLKARGPIVAVQPPDVTGTTGQTAQLQWRASGPPPVNHFVIEHRADTTGTWSQIGTVSTTDSVATDSTTGPVYRFEADDLHVGTHQFRLAVAPYGKTESRQTTRPVTARIELEKAYRLQSYPNPVRERATLELAVKEAQDVTVAVYDVLGRRVTTLHDGHLPAQKTERLSLDASRNGLSSGPYFVRVQGKDFAATERLTVVR